MKKIISYIYISLFAITSLCAQQKIDPTLEVNRDFDGKLLEIHKTKLNTTFDDSLSRFNLDFNYSIFNKPYRDMYEFNPLPSLQLEKATFAEFTKLYVKASAGYPFNPKGEIYYQPKIDKRDNPKNTLVFWGKLDAFIGDIKLDNYNSTNNSYTLSDIKVKANNSKWDIGTCYNHNWENGILYSKLSYGGFRNSFYGANALTNSDFSYDYRTVNSVKANFGVSSIDATAKGSKFNYNFEFD